MLMSSYVLSLVCTGLHGSFYAYSPVCVGSIEPRAFRFGENNSIRQFDKTDACTLIVTHRLIVTYDYFLIVCIIDFLR